MIKTIQDNKHAVQVRLTKVQQRIELSNVRRFHQDVLPGYRKTDLTKLALTSQDLGQSVTRFKGSVYVKDESDRYGLPAFKVLGAAYASFVAMCEAWQLDPHTATVQELRHHAQSIAPTPLLVAATDGNHGRAVAFFSNLVGLGARIYIPSGVSLIAETAISAEGPNVDMIRLLEDYDECVRQAAAFAAAGDPTQGQQRLLIQDTAWQGYTHIPQLIVDGYQTIFREVDEELASRNGQQATHVFCPVGVGSLADAAVQHYTAVRDEATSLPAGMATSVIAVEPAGSACLSKSIAKGRLTSVQTRHTIMAGLNCGTPSYTAWPNLQAGIQAVVTIEDERALDAVQRLHTSGIAAGPCGGAPLAALQTLFSNPVEAERLGLLDDERVVVVLLMTEGGKSS
ncbi:diaminopropionate ammonia-lyase [Moesziomyces aphidis]|uniref:Diaminopropionate ammonia-lyase n=1 Tax=Moesziomyces aphidis TaxID=84754 RepID=W3VFN7_MOEAP|nr:diaminopropionate ammonia-lyase [Moesziomyces aphidis]